MGIIHHVRSYFQKSTMGIRLDAHTRTIIVLTIGKLTGFYFLPILYAIYISVTTHLRQGKKVSILLPTNVNLGPIRSRPGLLEDSPYLSHPKIPNFGM
jgi:hypothetical protein